MLGLVPPYHEVQIDHHIARQTGVGVHLVAYLLGAEVEAELVAEALHVRGRDAVGVAFEMVEDHFSGGRAAGQAVQAAQQRSPADDLCVVAVLLRRWRARLLHCLRHTRCYC